MENGLSTMAPVPYEAVFTAARMRAIRAHYDETQKEFATRLGVSVDAIKDAEKAKARPSFKLAEALYQRCAIDPNWLYFAREEYLSPVLRRSLNEHLARETQDDPPKEPTSN